jgi:hypothetical protein
MPEGEIEAGVALVIGAADRIGSALVADLTAA